MLSVKERATPRAREKAIPTAPKKVAALALRWAMATEQNWELESAVRKEGTKQQMAKKKDIRVHRLSSMKKL
jgi:hypothetical protein